jgi:hypothetical protein
MAGRPIWLVVCLFLLAGCTQAVLSSATVEASAQPGEGCHNNVGAYHLPRRLVTATVSGTEQRYDISVNSNKLIADKETFCLDFLFSGVSDDRIGVQREGNLLLKRVTTSLDDRSKYIATASIQAAGDLVAFSQAQSLAREAREAKVAPNFNLPVISFDPFDRQDVERTNVDLRPYGYCIYLDGTDDPYVPSWSNTNLCRLLTPSLPNGQESNSVLSMRQGRELQRHGIIYQPELSHRLVIMRKADPGSTREQWQMAATEYVTMPNKAPLFALGVNRALFVNAKTDVTFDRGLITNISVVRPSELNALVDIPVYAAQVALSIPATTLAIFENQANNREKLWQTHAELIKTLRSMKNERLRDQVIADGGIPRSPVDLVGLGRSADVGGLANRQLAREACLQNADLIGSDSPEQLCAEYAIPQ